MTTPVCICDPRIGPSVPSSYMASLRAVCRFPHEEDMPCAIVGCARPATKGSLCQPCWTWAYVTLADKRYMKEAPPAPPDATGQRVLL